MSQDNRGVYMTGIQIDTVDWLGERRYLAVLGDNKMMVKRGGKKRREVCGQNEEQLGGVCV